MSYIFSAFKYIHIWLIFYMSFLTFQNRKKNLKQICFPMQEIYFSVKVSCTRLTVFSVRIIWRQEEDKYVEDL